MLNAIPIVGWFISIIVACSLAVPFYFIWNALGPVYFYFVPEVYKHIPFWDCVGLFILLPILKWALVPSLISSSSSSGSGSK